MPPKETTKTKMWGQADKDLLADLTIRQLINFTDTTPQNIEQVRELHFRHHDKNNFRRNFRDYSAAWDLEIKYSGTQHNGGKMRRLLLSIFFACTRPLTRRFLPLPSSFYLDEEVAGDEEGIDDDNIDNAAEDIDATAAAAADDNGYATMPPKVKPIPTKAATKKESAAAAVMPPPPAAAAATAPGTSFSVDASNPLTSHYYADGVYDYADVVFRVNGTMQKGEYQVQVAKDGLSVVRAISSRSFDKKILKKIMGKEYHESSARVIAWGVTALEMQADNVRPLNGLFWGERQVVRLWWKCTGTPTAVNKHDYPTEYYRVKDKQGEWHVQCDCIMLVMVRKAEEWTQAKLEVESSYMDLFGVDSSQSQRSDGPPSPPPRRHKKREERHAHAVDSSSEEGGGGRRGQRRRWRR